jgi:N-acetyl-anhydromuramyl-L-alanine amidase AmpD
MLRTLFLIFLSLSVYADTPLQVIDKPIIFGKARIEMTREYIQEHYDLSVHDIEITPRIIVLHWTAEMDFERSFARLEPEYLLSDRTDIKRAGALNVSAHYLIDRQGRIFRLMPDHWMARHVIGLNYSAIGIENVGGKENQAEDLTLAQQEANIALVRYLKAKYPTIEYLIGHHEYRAMEDTPLWLERDAGYRTQKRDPGNLFMTAVRKGVADLSLRPPPKSSGRVVDE